MKIYTSCALRTPTSTPKTFALPVYEFRIRYIAVNCQYDLNINGPVSFISCTEHFYGNSTEHDFFIITRDNITVGT
jgi:hypothetical protein